MQNILRSANDVSRYLTAGKAVVTLTSHKTGDHITLRFARTKNNAHRFFVGFQVANEKFDYIGLLDSGQFRTTARSYQHPTAIAATKFLCDSVLGDGVLPKTLDVQHEGACGRCGRVLTDPDSINRGIGPDCLKMMGS